MTIDLLSVLSSIFIFPGLAFLSFYATFAEWLDRKLYARFQNRVGPPIYQPVADIIKLLSKETIIPKAADNVLFRILPGIALSCVATAIMMIPVTNNSAVYSFQGDLVVVIYLLTIPTMTFFLAGWSSSSPYALLGSVRVLTQLFAYEVPLFMAVLGPAILAGTWSISGITDFFSFNPLLLIVNIPGMLVALLSLQGKLERVPFDIPHSETEIVGGAFTEYSGRLLAFFLLAIDMEMVVGAALISAVFLGGPMGFSGIPGFALFIMKTMIVIFILALIKALMARIRIDQMVNFCWKIMAPIALFQLILNLVVKARL